jgi:hypothetical protein
VTITSPVPVSEAPIISIPGLEIVADAVKLPIPMSAVEDVVLIVVPLSEDVTST